MASRLVLSAWLVAASAVFVSAQTVSLVSVRGTVVDENGRAIRGATVRADALNSTGLQVAVPEVSSDEAGRFAFRGLQPGEYAISASKEDDGYPDTSFSFYHSGKPHVAEVRPSAEATDIRLVLGHRSGVLMISVRDQANGQPITATLTLWRANNPQLWLSRGVQSNTRILIPADVPVFLKIVSKGYIPWNKSDRPLSLRSSEQRSLTVSLAAIPDSQDHK